MANRRVSSISRVQEEATQSHVRRVPLIRKLGDHFGKTVVALQSSFHFANGLISDDDATILEEFLLSTHVRNGLLLFLNSPGGSGLAAERIIRPPYGEVGGDHHRLRRDQDLDGRNVGTGSG
jgi:ClpP class serine protease